MDHHRATEQLTSFVDGRLGLAEARELERHLVECEECRDWVATYRSLASFFGSMAPGAELDHLSSDEISRLALTESTLTAPFRERCEEHLELCAECAGEVSLVRAAAAEARLPAPLALPRFRRLDRPAAHRLLAVAAGLLLAAGVAFVGGSLGGRPAGSETESPAVARRAAEPLTTAPPTVEPEPVLVPVETGARLDVVLKSGETVAFGDGFEVASGGALSIVAENTSDS